MRIDQNTSASLQGLSANYMRMQKQRLAARSAGGTGFQGVQPAAAQGVQAKQAEVAALPAQAAQTSRSAVIGSRADSVQISQEALQAQIVGQRPKLSAAIADTAAPEPKADSVKPEPTLSSAVSTPPGPTPKDVENLQAAFGASKGDSGYDATLDLDGDGAVNTLDLVRMLGQIR